MRDWAISVIPDYGWLVYDGINLVALILVIGFVMVPCLQACGIPVDPSSQWSGNGAAKGFYWACGLALLSGLLIALNKFRYIVEIDKVPLSNSLYNISIGVGGGCGYGVLRYLERRSDRRTLEKPNADD